MTPPEADDEPASISEATYLCAHSATREPLHQLDSEEGGEGNARAHSAIAKELVNPGLSQPRRETKPGRTCRMEKSALVFESGPASLGRIPASATPRATVENFFPALDGKREVASRTAGGKGGRVDFGEEIKDGLDRTVETSIRRGEVPTPPVLVFFLLGRGGLDPLDIRTELDPARRVKSEVGAQAGQRGARRDRVDEV